MAFKDNLGKRVRKVRKNRVVVDLNNRLKRSFGTPVGQHAEIHYQGRPFSFAYTGQIESLTIDIVHREQEKEEKKYGIKTDHTVKEDVTQTLNVERFDPTSRRSEEADVYASCSCGSKFKTKVLVEEARWGNEVLKRRLKDRDIKDHMKDPDHTVTIDYVEVRTEKVPEEDRIKDFDQDKVHFYRLFPTKTAEVKYLATYDQDLLAEAPQVQYSQTSKGSEYLRKQNMAITFFLFGVFLVFEYLLVSATSSGAIYNPHPAVNYTPWYIVIITLIAAVVAVWKVKLHEMSKTMVKYINVQSAPFHISNRGILPVVLTNSALNPMWEFQAKMMKADDRNARDLYYSITSWSDNQIAELDRAKTLGQVEHELTIIHGEISDIQKLDYEYRNAQTVKKATPIQIMYAVFGTVGIYTLLMFALGFL